MNDWSDGPRDGREPAARNDWGFSAGWETETSYGSTVPAAPRRQQNHWYRRWQVWLVFALVVASGFGFLASFAGPDFVDGPIREPAESLSSSSALPSAAEPTPSRSTSPPSRPVVLLFITDQKDGDSWVASDGKEYRLGLVDTPEYDERCGSEAAEFTRDFVASGFAADAYTTDTYGRHVAEVFDEAGKSLNVALARSGLGRDTYLEQFRHENPDLARRLDLAFASAASPNCGPSSSAAPVPFVQESTTAPRAAGNCMAGYSPCLPIRADMDCGEIGHPVSVTGGDPYRLDRDGDGVGCD